ncbi:MAG: aldo/keto reductase [Lachnospiraceae bacterium]|nr:aldo/keto reductase [Lachnospiraceae bacterium]
MIYSKFGEKQLSLLGFGAMRLPVKEDGTVDKEQVKTMVRHAMDHGVNYFDTAWPYHDGQSETVMGEVLSEYDRDSYYLATKYPGHQISETYDPAALFEAQLEKCGVDYFDFYLLHNVYEKSMDVYLDPQWGILDYFKEQKRLGRIKHLGFSTHAQMDCLKEFLDACGEDMEFCQIQLNYLDWTLQDAKAKYDLLTEKGIPVWVMEPVRGGKLTKLDEANEQTLKALRPDEKIPAWAFRFLQGLPNVKMILSGMSDQTQMEDNVSTFADSKPLTKEETEVLLKIAESMKDSVPCTACRYCCKGCPMGLDIPMLIGIYNEIRIIPTVNAVMRIEGLPKDKQPSACIGCGKCMQICPQNINIPAVMKDLNERMQKIPSWEEICRQRAAAQPVPGK